MWITFDIEVKGALSLNECSLNPIKVEVSGSFIETVYGWKLLLKSDFILFFYANHLCTRDKHEMRTFLSQLIFLSMLYKKYSKDIFNFEICYRYDEGSNRAFCSRPILKSLARLLPELYSTQSNCYYQCLLVKLQALVSRSQQSYSGRDTIHVFSIIKVILMGE